MKPHITAAAAEEKLGTVVLGTVKGDIHDIGKDIVATMLDIGGFEVVDLGVDVPVEVGGQGARGAPPGAGPERPAHRGLRLDEGYRCRGRRGGSARRPEDHGRRRAR